MQDLPTAKIRYLPLFCRSQLLMLFIKNMRFAVLGLFTAGLSVLYFQGCASGTQPIQVELSESSRKIQLGDTLEIVLRNLAVSAEESIQVLRGDSPMNPEYSYRDKEGDWHLKFVVSTLPLGTQEIELSWDDPKRGFRERLEFLLLSDRAPSLYGFRILNTYPHDPKAFTQGLEFDGDTLWESTGQRGESTLRVVDYRSGEVMRKRDLPRNIFGEGITVWKDSVIMLSWTSGKGFVFDKNSMEPRGEFSYQSSKQGWGLCHDQNWIYKSDGSRYLWLLDPRTLIESGKLEIVSNRSSFRKANELEYYRGKIYANVYGKYGIMIIDAKSGAVIDMSDLDTQIEKGANWDPANNVLNGIAVHPERGTLFVTGKRWNKLFEVAIELLK